MDEHIARPNLATIERTEGASIVKDQQITIRFSAAQIAVLQAIAKADNRSLAFTVRRLTISAAKRRRPDQREQLEAGLEDARTNAATE